MARYEYRCESCERLFEVVKPMAHAAQSEACPQCGKTAKRIFSAPGICIKGAPIKFKHSGETTGSGGCQGCDHGSCGF